MKHPRLKRSKTREKILKDQDIYKGQDQDKMSRLVVTTYNYVTQIEQLVFNNGSSYQWQLTFIQNPYLCRDFHSFTRHLSTLRVATLRDSSLKTNYLLNKTVSQLSYIFYIILIMGMYVNLIHLLNTLKFGVFLKNTC